MQTLFTILEANSNLIGWTIVVGIILLLFFAIRQKPNKDFNYGGRRTEGFKVYTKDDLFQPQSQTDSGHQLGSLSQSFFNLSLGGARGGARTIERLFQNYINNYIKGKQVPTQIINFGWLLLLTGISSLFASTAGFAMYALLLYILSLLTCCFCPCIGAMGVAGTTAIWGTLFIVDIYIALIFLVSIGVAGLIGLICSFFYETNNKTEIIIYGLIQIAIGSVGVLYLYPLLNH